MIHSFILEKETRENNMLVALELIGIFAFPEWNSNNNDILSKNLIYRPKFQCFETVVYNFPL